MLFYGTGKKLPGCPEAEFMNVIFSRGFQAKTRVLCQKAVHEFGLCKDSVIWKFTFLRGCCWRGGGGCRIFVNLFRYRKCEIVYISMFDVVFDRIGANAYVKNLRVLSQRKIRETWFYEIF